MKLISCCWLWRCTHLNFDEYTICISKISITRSNCESKTHQQQIRIFFLSFLTVAYIIPPESIVTFCIFGLSANWLWGFFSIATCSISCKTHKHCCHVVHCSVWLRIMFKRANLMSSFCKIMFIGFLWSVRPLNYGRKNSLGMVTDLGC